MVSILVSLRQRWRDRHAANADYDDCQPILPWMACAIAMVIVPVLIAGAMYFGRLSRNPPSHPVLADQQDRP